MNIGDFLKDKALYLLAHFVVCLISFLSLLVLNSSGGTAFAAITCSLYIIGAALPLIAEYMRKKEFCNELRQGFEQIDRKNLLAEVIKRPGFYEGNLFYDLLRLSNKACLEEINSYKAMQEEYREYIELWVHEIKTPIASSKLIAQNNKSEPVNSMLDELDSIEGYVEQALFYARSSTVEKDYFIRELNLEKPVYSVLKRNSALLIRSGISVSAENLNSVVYSDIKWLEFILNQLVINSIKYAKEADARIEISSLQKKNTCLLMVRDNGIGIPQSELPEIFNKGFTGTNGRLRGKTTGMGLYICKKLCDKLGISITAKSEEGAGTTITLIFPKNSMTSIIDLQKCKVTVSESYGNGPADRLELSQK